MLNFDSTVIISSENTLENVEESSYYPIIKFMPEYLLVFLHDEQNTLFNKIFYSELIWCLRKTKLQKIMWCGNMSSSSSMIYDYHWEYNTLRYLNSAQCVVIIILEVASLFRQAFKRGLDIVKSKLRLGGRTKIISILSNEVANYISSSNHNLTGDYLEFLVKDLLESAEFIDPREGVVSNVLSVSASIIPLIVTSVYSNETIGTMNLDEFYTDSFVQLDVELTQPMHTWSTLTVVEWMSQLNYPIRVIEQLQQTHILCGYILVNINSQDLKECLSDDRIFFKRRLLHDICQHLDLNDGLNNDWKIKAVRAKSNLNQVYFMMHQDDESVAQTIAKRLKVAKKSLTFQYLPVNSDRNQLNSNKILAKFSPTLSTSSLVMIVVTTNILSDNQRYFQQQYEEAILFTLWLNKPIVFILWNTTLDSLDYIFKLIINNQYIVDFRNDLNNFDPKFLVDFTETILQADEIKKQTNLRYYLIRNFDSRETTKTLIKDNSPSNSIVLHFHKADRNKAMKMKKVLQNEHFNVNIVTVEQTELLKETSVNTELQEDMFLKANLIILCVSESYIQNSQTKSDMKLISQIMRKPIFPVVVEKLSSMKMWPAFINSIDVTKRNPPNSLRFLPKSSKSKNDIFNILHPLDLTECETAQKIELSDLVKNVKDFLFNKAKV